MTGKLYLPLVLLVVALAVAILPPASAGPDGHSHDHGQEEPALGDSSSLLALNETWETSFPNEGTSFYHCVPHPTNMTGRVKVSATDPNAKTHVNVTIQNYRFTPEEVVVKPGGTVNWTNKDAVQHNVHLYDFQAATTHDAHQTPGAPPLLVVAALGGLALAARRGLVR